MIREFAVVLTSIMIVASLLGMLYTRFIKQEKNNLALNYVAGILIMFGLFQVLAIPSILMNTTFKELTFIYSLAIVILCLMSILLNIKRLVSLYKKTVVYVKRKASKVKHFKREQFKKSILNKTNWFFVLVLVISVAQMVLNQLVEFRIRSENNIFYVSSALTTMHTDLLYRYNPLTGLEMVTFFEPYILSPYPIFYAFLSEIFNVHPTIIVYNIFPVLLILFYTCTYYLIGKEIFQDVKKAMKFVFFCQIVILFSGFGCSALGYFALLHLHTGTALFYIALFPLLFYFCARLYHQESRSGNWFILVILLLASSMVSLISIVVNVVAIVILGFINLIYTKRPKDTCCILLCSIPNIILILIYLMKTNCGIMSVFDEFIIRDIGYIIITSAYQMLRTGNIIISIYFLSLVCICFLQKNKRVKRMFLTCSGTVMLMYFFPLTPYLMLILGVDVFIIYRILLILPAIIVIPYSIIFFEEVFKKKKYETIFFVGVLLYFVLRGTTAYSIVGETENRYRVPLIVQELTNAIDYDANIMGIEEKRVIFSSDLLPYVRQYDASIITLADFSVGMQSDENIYLSENSQDILYMMDSDRIDGRSLGRLMELEEYNYLVVWRYTFGIESLGLEFEEVSEVSEYVILRRESIEFKPTVFENVDYYLVFDYYYYINRYEDVAMTVGTDPMAVLEHFVTIGMAEGRTGSAAFNPYSYKNNHIDLIEHFGDDWEKYYLHYISFGNIENRETRMLFPRKDDVDYRSIFSFDFFIGRYPELVEDIETLEGVLQFFLEEGMDLGLQGTRTFDVFYYKENNPDLQELFGDDLRLYYLHYLEKGMAENRRAFTSPVLEIRSRR